MFFLASAGSRRYRREHAVVEPPATHAPATHAPPWAIPSATASAPGRGTNAPSRGADETDRRAEPPRRREEPPVVRAGRHHHPWRRMAVLATAAAATAGARRQGQRWHSSQRSRRRYSDHAAASREPRRPPQPGNAHGETCRRRRRRSTHQRLITARSVNFAGPAFTRIRAENRPPGRCTFASKSAEVARSPGSRGQLGPRVSGPPPVRSPNGYGDVESLSGYRPAGPTGDDPQTWAQQPVAKVGDPAWPRRGRVSYTERHGDGQETGGATGVADVGGHGGPSDERWASLLRAAEPGPGGFRIRCVRRGVVRGLLRGRALRGTRHPFCAGLNRFLLEAARSC